MHQTYSRCSLKRLGLLRQPPASHLQVTRGGAACVQDCKRCFCNCSVVQPLRRQLQTSSSGSLIYLWCCNAQPVSAAPGAVPGGRCCAGLCWGVTLCSFPFVTLQGSRAVAQKVTLLQTFTIRRTSPTRRTLRSWMGLCRG